MGEGRAIDDHRQPWIGDRFLDRPHPGVAREVGDQRLDRDAVFGFESPLQLRESLTASRDEHEIMAIGRETLGIRSADAR